MSYHDDKPNNSEAWDKLCQHLQGELAELMQKNVELTAERDRLRAEAAGDREMLKRNRRQSDADELMFLRDQAGHKNPESRASIHLTGQVVVSK